MKKKITPFIFALLFMLSLVAISGKPVHAAQKVCKGKFATHQMVLKGKGVAMNAENRKMYCKPHYWRCIHCGRVMITEGSYKFTSKKKCPYPLMDKIGKYAYSDKIQGANKNGIIIYAKRTQRSYTKNNYIPGYSFCYYEKHWGRPIIKMIYTK